MRARQYVVPILTNHRAPEPDSPDAAIDAIEWANRIAGLRERVMALSDVLLIRYLPWCDFSDLMGLVVSKPLSVELQLRIAKLLFPTFLSDGFLRHCNRCGERLLPPAVAAGIGERVEEVLAFQEASSATAEQLDELRGLSMQLAQSDDPTWPSRVECHWSLFELMLVTDGLGGPLGARLAQLVDEKDWAETARFYEKYADPVISRESAAGAIAGATVVLAGQRWPRVWPSVPKAVEDSVPEEVARDEEESFLTDEEVDALLEGVSESSPQTVTDTSALTESLQEPSVPEAASANDTAQKTDDASQAEATNLETLAGDPLRLASYVKGMPNAALKLLLVEQAFGLYEDTLANFLWFIKDGELICKVLQRMTLHDGRLLMEKLNTLWFGKSPDAASLEEKQAGQAAVTAILKQIGMIKDEGRMV